MDVFLPLQILGVICAALLVFIAAALLTIVVLTLRDRIRRAKALRLTPVEQVKRARAKRQAWREARIAREACQVSTHQPTKD